MTTDHREIATQIFRLGGSVHAKAAIMRRSARFWMAVAFPVAALVVCGLFYDSRLLFIAAIIVFILFPTLLLIGWHSILTRPWAVASVYPQKVILNPDNEITVEYFPDNETGATNIPGELVIPAAAINDCRVWGRNIIISYEGNRELIIPLSAFEPETSAAAFINRIDEAISAISRR